MQRLIRRTGQDGERGATFVTFAMFLMIMLGFVGVGIDGAAVYAKRQHVQTGADAAAFAVAQEHALTGCVEDSAVALAYAAPNVPNETATTTIDDVECGNDGGIPYVRVLASAEQPPFFLQAVGATAIRVPASATVEWGSPVAGAAFPLTIAQCEFEHVLDLNGGAYDGTPIEVWIPNYTESAKEPGPSYCSDDPSGDYPPGGFGWLETSGECQGDYVDLDDGATWVDGSAGNDAPKDCDWTSLIGTTVIIPIFDTASTDPSTKDYSVVVFASVEIVGLQVQTPTAAGGQKRYGFASPYSDKCKKQPTEGKWTKHCFFGVFREYVSIDDHWELGPVDDSGVIIIRLKS